MLDSTKHFVRYHIYGLNSKCTDHCSASQNVLIDKGLFKTLMKSMRRANIKETQTYRQTKQCHSITMYHNMEDTT